MFQITSKSDFEGRVKDLSHVLVNFVWLLNLAWERYYRALVVPIPSHGQTALRCSILPSKSLAFTNCCIWASVGFDPSMRIAYLSSLVDSVPFSLRSKHLKASRYSKRKQNQLHHVTSFLVISLNQELSHVISEVRTVH